MPESFSQRHGYAQPPKISFRENLPAKFRAPIVNIAGHLTGARPLWLIVERVRDPYGIDPNQIEPPKGIAGLFATDYNLKLVCQIVDGLDWHQVCDVTEAVHAHLASLDGGTRIPADAPPKAPAFERELNAYFVSAGVGWQMSKGQIVTRGEEAFEVAVDTANAALTSANRLTAVGRLESAVRALSQRPTADAAGAVSHATSCIECVLGEITGEALTLGKYLDRYPRMFHPALKKALDGLYGYASDAGARHGREGVEPTPEEARFMVAVCASVCTLLTNQPPQQEKP